MDRKAALWVMAIGAAAIAVARLFRLALLPIFNDEAIYLRWAQLVGSEPSLAIRIPLIDPKPPLHTGAIAVFMSAGFEPLLSARAVSVFAAVIMIPLLVLLMREMKSTVTGAIVLVALIVTSPFLSFYQRLATADALFVTESVACVLLALRLAHPVSLGCATGLALLTRQVFSLAILPVTLAATVMTGRTPRAVVRWLAAVLVALAMLTPYLAANRRAYAGGVRAELTRRMLHTSQLREMAAGQRLDAVKRNVRDVGGWMFHYLTPPVAAAAALSLVLLLWRRRRAGVLLLLWVFAMIAPTIVFGVITYPRYVLAAVVPLLVAVALAVSIVFRPALALGAAVLLCLWPARDLSMQLTRWDRQPLLRIDRWQYISGWSAGYGMQQALEWMEARLAHENATLITGEGWGIPDDVVWVRFAGDPRVTLRYVASTRTVPDLSTTRTYAPTWHPQAREMPVPGTGAVYYFARLVGQEPMQHGGPTVEDPIAFTNPRMAEREPLEGVVVYRLR